MKKIYYILLIIPLFFLLGCDGKSNTKTKGTSYNFICPYPTKPDFVDVELLSKYDTLYSGTKAVYELQFKNPMNDELTIKYWIIPNMGKTIEKEAKVEAAIIRLIKNKPDIIEGLSDVQTVTFEIPEEPEVDTFVATLRYKVSNVKTKIRLLLCLGYDPEYVKEVKKRHCNPKVIVDECYSSSPVYPSKIEVTPAISTKYAKYRIKIDLDDLYFENRDEFSGVCWVDENTKKRKIHVSKIRLKIGDTWIDANSDVIKCNVVNGDIQYYDKRRLERAIICTIDFNALKQKGLIDDLQLKYGKFAELYIELTYDYCREILEFIKAKVVTYTEEVE